MWGFAWGLTALLIAGSEIGHAIPEDSPVAYIILIGLIGASAASLMSTRN